MRQELFELTARNGTVVALVRLESQYCAIEQDGAVMECYAGDDEGLRKALKGYFETVERHGGAHHPFQALDGLCEHPHVG